MYKYSGFSVKSLYESLRSKFGPTTAALILAGSAYYLYKNIKNAGSPEGPINNIQGYNFNPIPDNLRIRQAEE